YVSGRMLHRGGTVAVELRCGFLFRGSASFQALSVGLVHILNIDVQLARYRIVLRGGIGHHDYGVANLDLGMAYMVFLVVDTCPLFCVESLSQEIDQSRYSIYDQVRCDGSVVLRSGVGLLVTDCMLFYCA